MTYTLKNTLKTQTHKHTNQNVNDESMYINKSIITLPMLYTHVNTRDLQWLILSQVTSQKYQRNSMS
jgi:hypothetical protein